MEGGLDIMVLQEEQAKCGNSSRGGGKKKNKQKIPQRGLGVAQLEKLRMEEQRKSAASSSSNAPQGMSLLPFRQPILPFLTATNDPSPMLRPVDNPDLPFRHSEAFSTPTNYVDNTPPRVFDNSIVSSANAATGFLPMLWNTMEPSPLNGEALARNFGHMNGDSLIPGWQQSLGLLQRRQQQLLSPISVVNKALPSSSSGISLPTSSGTILQMEPPSNQSYASNHNVSTLWPEEDKVVGMKRRWPHTSLPCKIPSFSRSYPDLIKPEPKTTDIRRGTSSSSICNVEGKRFLDLDNSNKENGGAMDGGFLTLGPSPTPSIPKLRQATLIQTPTVLDYPEFSFVPYQENMSDALSSSQLPFYSFLPMGPNSCEKISNEHKREALDGVDLNLKL